MLPEVRSIESGLRGRAMALPRRALLDTMSYGTIHFVSSAAQTSRQHILGDSVCSVHLRAQMGMCPLFPL